MKIDVNVYVSKTKKQEEGGFTQWPTMPFEDDEAAVPNLTVLFFDGTTEPSEEDDSGFAVMDAYDNPEITHDLEHRMHAPPTTGEWWVRFFQNSSEHDTDEITQSWKLAKDYENGRELLEVIKRQPLELLREPGPTEPDRRGEDEVFRIGVTRPNLKVTLLVQDQPVGRADLVSVYGSEVPAVFATGIDAVSDGDTEPLGYTWPNLPSRNFHVRVEELTAKSKRMMLRSMVERSGWPDYFAYTEEQVLTFEGVHWNWLDTSDTDNFKVTEKPEFSAEALDGPPVNLLQTSNTLRVFVFPRRWWCFTRYRDGNRTAGYYDTCYGVWARPPREHLLPEPRLEGCWQVGSPLPGEVSDSSGGSLDLANESNAFLEWVWTQDDAQADDMETNAYYFLDYREGNTDRMHPGGSGCYPGSGMSGDNIRMLWYTMLGDPEDEDLASATCNAFPCTNLDANPRSVWLEPWSNFWGSMPDCKIPVMDGTNLFGPSRPNWPYGWLPEWTAKEYWTYQEDSPIFPDESKNTITELRDYFLARPCMEDETPSGRLVAWTIAFAGARAEDLVGVIENEGRLLFVWRTTDEDLVDGEAPQIQAAEEDVYAGSEIWGPFNMDFMVRELAQVQGHIGFTWYRDRGSGNRTQTYLYTDWGHWYEYNGDSGDPLHPGVYHSDDISLGNGLIPLIAFDVAAETFNDDI